MHHTHWPVIPAYGQSLSQKIMQWWQPQLCRAASALAIIYVLYVLRTGTSNHVRFLCITNVLFGAQKIVNYSAK